MSQRLFLFCCRAFLKDGEEEDVYYKELGLTKHCTNDDIKKAFKKISLTNHPDKLSQRGIKLSNEHKQRFIRAKEAYDVLLDTSRRRIYDEIGFTGLKIVENPANINPLQLLKNYKQNSNDSTKLLITVLLLFALLLLFPILFCLKVDGSLRRIPYLLILVPLWLYDFVLVFYTLHSLQLCNNNASNNDYSSDNSDEDGSFTRDRGKTLSFTYKLSKLLSVSAFILMQLLICFRMDGDISWSWFKVFIPYYIYEILNIIVVIQSLNSMHHHSHSYVEGSTEDPEALLLHIKQEVEVIESNVNRLRSISALRTAFIRFIFMLLLAYKLVVDSIDWFVVLVVPWGCYFYFSILASQELKNYISTLQRDLSHESVAQLLQDDNIDPVLKIRLQYSEGLRMGVNCDRVLLGVVIFMFCLAFSRIEWDPKISTFYILIPIFIIISISCCCCFGVLICLSKLPLDDIENTLQAANSNKTDENSNVLLKRNEYGSVDSDRIEEGPLLSSIDLD